MCVVFKQMRSSSNHFENLAVLEVVLDSVVVYIRNSSINGYDQGKSALLLLLACKVLGIYLCSNTYILVRFLQNSSLHCIPLYPGQRLLKQMQELLLKLSHSAGLSVCLIMRFICKSGMSLGEKKKPPSLSFSHQQGCCLT